jgi:3-hydroxyacyl-CoA dehydrogenase
LLVAAMEREDWVAIDGMLRQLQVAFMGVKYARVPIVAAPHGYTLGAGCEISLHCAAIQAAPELRIGLPELHIGLVPAGGGIKELLARAMAAWDGVSDPFARVEGVFNLLVSPQNSDNAQEARKMGYLREGDAIGRNADRQLYEAKQKVLALANAGYAPPVEESIWVMGEEALARLRLRIHERFRAGLFTEHDRKVADRYAWILSGGGLPAGQAVSEWYLLRLEREGLIALGHERAAQERIRHLLATGKPLKN